MKTSFVLVGCDYKSTADVPRDHDVVYECENCKGSIPSVPTDNVGCSCGNVFVDKDCVRLIVEDLGKMSVLKKVGQ